MMIRLSIDGVSLYEDYANRGIGSNLQEANINKLPGDCQ